MTGNPPHVHLLSHGARAAVAWALVTIGLLAGAAQSERSPFAAAQAATPVASPSARTGPTPNDTPGPLQVTVGIYVIEVHGLDQEESTYHARLLPLDALARRTRPDADGRALQQRRAVDADDAADLSRAGRVAQRRAAAAVPRRGTVFRAARADGLPARQARVDRQIEDSTWSRDQLVYVPDTEQSNSVPRSPPRSVLPAGRTEHGSSTRPTTATTARPRRSSRGSNSPCGSSGRRAFSAGSCCCRC